MQTNFQRGPNVKRTIVNKKTFTPLKEEPYTAPQHFSSKIKKKTIPRKYHNED